MTDLDEAALAHLAPIVDGTAAHAQFDEARRRRRARRRAAIVGTVAGCLAVVALGTWAVVRDEGVVSVDTGLSDEPTDVYPAPAFEVLAVQSSSEPSGMLRAAVDQDSYQRLWTLAGLEGDPPPVDFDQRLIVTMAIDDDACPPTLTAFELDESARAVRPQLIESDMACIAPGSTWTYVVALDRAQVDPLLTVRLPEVRSPSHYAGEPSITIVTGATAPPGLIPPPCIEEGGTQVCLDNPGTAGLVALRATNLLPGSSLAVTLPDGRTEQYGADREPVAFFGAPTRGTMLTFHVAGTTTDGQPIDGTIGALG